MFFFALYPTLKRGANIRCAYGAFGSAQARCDYGAIGSAQARCDYGAFGPA